MLKQFRIILLRSLLFLLLYNPYGTFARRGAEDYYGDGRGSYTWLFLGAIFLIWLVIRDVKSKRTDRRRQAEFDAKKAKKEKEEEQKRSELELKEARWQASRQHKFSGTVDGFLENGNYRVIKSYKRVNTKGGSNIPQDSHEFTNLTEAKDFYDNIVIERDESKRLVLRSNDPESVNYGTSYENYEAVILDSWWTRPNEIDFEYYKIYPERHPYIQYRKSIDSDL